MLLNKTILSFIMCCSSIVFSDTISLNKTSDKSDSYKVSLVEEKLKAADFPILKMDSNISLTKYTLVIETDLRKSVVWQKISIDNVHSNYVYDKIHLLGFMTHKRDVYIVFKDSEYTYLDVYKVVGGGKVLLLDTELIPAYKSGFKLPALEMKYLNTDVAVVTFSYENGRFMEFHYKNGEIDLIKHIEP